MCVGCNSFGSTLLSFSSLTSWLLSSPSSHSMKEKGPSARDQEASSCTESSMGWEQQEAWWRPHRFFLHRSDRVPINEPRQKSQPLSGEWKMGGGKGGVETCWGGQDREKGIRCFLLLNQSFRLRWVALPYHLMLKMAVDNSHGRESGHQSCCVLIAGG